MNSRAKRPAVLLLAHGTPGSAADVPAYLRNITSGRPLPDAVVQEVQHRYSLIGRSPLTDITMQQAIALQRALDVPVYVGMRNWHPYVTEAMKQLVADNVDQVVAICLAPQNSRTSVGLYKRATLAEAGKLPVDFVDSWHDHPQLIQAFAEKLSVTHAEAEARHGEAVPVIFTAHSVPCRTINGDSPGEGDPYASQAKETARLVAAKVASLSDAHWHFAFQSQGMSGGPWIGPTVESTIEALAAEGHLTVIIHPVGFVCDHVEVLYDIDIAFRKQAGQLGMRLYRPASLNDSPTFISALVNIARQYLG